MGKHTWLLHGILAVALSSAPLAAQAYRPTYENPNGRPEIIMVYVTASWCGPCHTPGLAAEVDTLKVVLQHRADSSGQRFRAVVVDLDWEVDSGLAFIRDAGVFDEVDVGRNWFGSGAAQHIWADTTAPPSLPQVATFEQPISMGARIALGVPTLLHRVVGPPAIMDWLRAGAPLQRSVPSN